MALSSTKTAENLPENMEKLNLNSSKTKVFVIYTGGTIGMTAERDAKGKEVLQPTSNFFGRVSKLSNFNDAKYTNKYLYTSSNTYALPLRGNNRIIYEIFEYPKPKDSSNINTEDWNEMAKRIQEKYENYDGFVIVHGTDTMAYTSSVLSFMFEKPCKPIVLTGSQIPMFDKDEKPRADSDGSDNLLGALYVAGHVAIPEVTLFFNKTLYRGNRVIKFVNNKMDAFFSPNFAPLLVVDNVEMLYVITLSFQNCSKNDQRVLCSRGSPPDPTWVIRTAHNGSSLFKILATSLDMYSVKTHHTQQVPANFKNYVGILKLYPGITAETVRKFMESNDKGSIKGIVLETYGAGNGPTDDDILKELKNATDGGMLVLNCTQCVKGVVSSNYETGKALQDAGVIPGEDITSEAALGKLLYVINKSNHREAQQPMLKSNLRGEITL